MKRAVRSAISAFCVTTCVLFMIAGLAVAGVRSDRTLSGDRYEMAAASLGKAVDNTADLGARWLPAQLRALFYLPQGEAALWDLLLSKTEK